MAASNLTDAWIAVTEQAKTYDDIDSAQVDAFFARLCLQAMSDGFCMITAENAFLKGWVEQNYREVIARALQDLYGMPFMVMIEVDPSQAAAATAPKPMPAPVRADEPAVGSDARPIEEMPVQAFETIPSSSANPFDRPNPFARATASLDPDPPNPQMPRRESPAPRDSRRVEDDQAPAKPSPPTPASTMTFANFVIGDSNRMAYEMALVVAENPGQSHLNPLFIYGSSGLGKTHLMRAIQNSLRETHPHFNVVYSDIDGLVDGYAEASASRDTRKNSFKAFKSAYENADVLLIDDVQKLQTKPSTLEVVFQLFNKFIDQGKQVILAADRAPKNIDIDERYTTRFNKGGTFDVQPPNSETKLAIIREYMAELTDTGVYTGLALPREAQERLAEMSGPNVRELKSAVTSLLSYMTTFNRTDLTGKDVDEILRNHFSGGPTKPLTVADIQKEVELFYNVTHAELTGDSHSRRASHPRQVAMYLCRNLTTLSYKEIGGKFNRGHSTVISSINTISTKIVENRELKEELEILKRFIREGHGN